MRGYVVSAIVLTLLVITVACTVGYRWLMFGWTLSPESLIEDLNYSLQTVTTVGYGNWVPAGWDLTQGEVQARILRVKALSIPFVLVGGSLFAVLVGIVSTILSRR